MNFLSRFTKFLLPYLMLISVVSILTACGSEGQADMQNTGRSSSLSATSTNDPLDASINKTQMLADLNAFFKEATLTPEDQQQINAASQREATQRGRLPNYMAGETLSSPSVLASAGIKAQSGITAEPQANFLYSTPVYRFYNLLTNVHFYTASESERTTVVNTAPHFRDEGIGFFASNNAAEPNTAPVYRFYNYGSGAHFYTISQSERDTVINNFSQYYRFEGIAWYANPNADADLTPMYRFYNFNVGAHFYTTSSSERAYVLATFPFMRDEGIAYYVAASRSYTIGGTTSGLGSGKTVVLTLNGGADLSISSNSSFAFGSALLSAQPYTVAVKTQPVAQSCSVANGSGTVNNVNISNITVTCTNVITPVTIGGSLTGLSSGSSVVLSLNGGSDLTLNSNAGFTFAGTILSGQTYAVTVKTQPSGQFCSVTNGSGTVPATNVTNVAVSCLNYVTIGGSISGLNAGNSLTLRLNGVQNKIISSNAAYSFSTPLLSGQTYSVLIQTQPVGQICSVVNGTGTAISNVTNVNVTCVSQVKVGGTVTGLGAGKTITLTLNGSTDLAVTTSNFQFPTVLTTGQLYSVIIKTQPTGQTCSISNSSGTAANANVTNVAVACVNNVTIGGNLSGLNASGSVTLTLNGGGDLVRSTNGAFTFAGTVPDTQAFSVVVKTQPIGQTCSVSNGNGTAAGNVTNIAVVCVNNAPTGLLISEVASCPTGNCWFEVFNPTASTLDLSNYTLQSSSKNSAGTNIVHTFALPSLSIAPNAYAIVMGNASNTILPLNPQTALAYDAGFYPSWTANGFIELLSAGATVDFVKFGTSTQMPSTSAHWAGASVAALSSSVYGNAIVRAAGTIATQDSNSASDWISVTFATPAGQNDVPAGAVDADSDGIPDSSELPGSTYAGMTLYSMGARQGVRDIFVEVDHMNSTDPGVIPRAEALQKVVDAFAAKGIAMHFDAGNQFSASFSPANFNLGQGNSTVTYEKCTDFDRSICISNVSQLRSLYDWKRANFELRRKNIFHYMLFANSQLNSGTSGSSGRAEIIGNDSMITLGGWGLTTSPDTNRLINYQAGTVMHEFGHNLGLLHGGNDSAQNYKPNYYSVMNYLYQLQGLASSASSIGPFQRWARNYLETVTLCGMLNSACDSPSQFVIDYSNGSSASLNESALSESANIGRGADVGVYADWNNNLTNNATTYAKDLNGTGNNTTLTDFNDWANLVLPFLRYSSANTGISPQASSTLQTTPFDPLSDDKQPLSDCTPNPLWLRLAMQPR